VKANKQAAMLKAFDAFRDRIAERYQEARDLLADGKYEEAQDVLAKLAQSHARTSLSLRNVLVREGVIGGDDK
jgi:outer membrane protein assembly factor BamD (BamD/ComL family)